MTLEEYCRRKRTKDPSFRDDEQLRDRIKQIDDPARVVGIEIFPCSIVEVRTSSGRIRLTANDAAFLAEKLKCAATRAGATP